MKLTANSIAQLDSLVQNCLIAGIKKVIISDGTIRGVDDKQTTVIITDSNVPDLDGKALGVNRIDQLSARLALIKSQGDFTLEATVAANNSDISILDLSAGKAKAQFRCASIEAVKGVPKKINDVMAWEVKVNSKLLAVLTPAVGAMGAETVTLASRDGTSVSIECVDANKDVFTIDADEAPVFISAGTKATSFCQKYPAKTLVTLIKEALKSSDPVTLKIGEGGILSLKVNGFDFFLLPAQ